MKHLSSRTARRGLVPLLSSAFALPLLAALVPSAEAAPVQARKADDFVDSIGVCLHVQNYDDASWNTVKTQLGTLGVRYFRDGLEHVDNATNKARLQSLYDSYGMKMLAVCGPYGNNNLQPVNGSLSQVATKVASVKPMILAVEGPNEPEYFWYDGWNYGGYTDRPNQVLWYQNKLYDALKADASTSSIPVSTFALARVETVNNWNWSTTKPLVKHDALAWHYYNGRQLPTPYDTINLQRSAYSSDPATKPAFLTEHGYRISGDGNVTQKAQMKLDARSMAFFFNWDNYNNQKVFFYVAGPDAAAPGEDYGLDNADYTPRPAYNSMKSVISYLKEATWNSTSKTWNYPSFSPGSLDYTVSGDAGSYGWRLVQKSNGEFYLMALPYIQVSDNATGNDVANATHNVTLSFVNSQKISQYKVDEATGNYSEMALTSGASSINVTLGDTLTIFKISPVGTASPIPIGKTIGFKANITGKFVTANLNASGIPLISGWASTIGSWERFSVESAGTNLVALKSVQTGKYVSCNLNGGNALQASYATSVGSWEKFTWQDLGNQNFCLIANINGKYVSSDQNTTNKDLKASWATGSGSWENFSWVNAP